MTNLKTTIGLEIHVQLKTMSKMFCRCDNNAENKAPNTTVCPICLGMPGVKKVYLRLEKTQAIAFASSVGIEIERGNN